MPASIVNFLRTEAGGGMLLAAAALLAIIVANTGAAPAYFALLDAPLRLDVGFWSAELTAKHWVKDGLMAVFFYVIGLELKREITTGELSDPKALLLPVVAALGGAIAPVLIYLAIAGGADPRAWPVPVATDIAFALAALAVLAPKADPRLRIFLLTLAVVDDLIAIVLIAVLYTSQLALTPLIAAFALLLATWFAGRRLELPAWFYLVAALAVWALALESGVHTSVMAVAAAFAVPIKAARSGRELLEKLEHAIHPASAFFVLPVFAFAAAGVSLAGLGADALLGAVPVAIALGLALGKPIGVTLAYSISARALKIRESLPVRAVFGVGCLCGIGFTMSLFIAGLAYAADPTAETQVRIGVIAGSLLALVMSAIAVRMTGMTGVLPAVLSDRH